MNKDSQEMAGAPGAGPTPCIDRQEIIRNAIAASAADLARSAKPSQAIAEILASIGEATAVSRIALYKADPQHNGHLTITQRYEWDAAGIAPTRTVRAFVHVDMEAEGPGCFLQNFIKGEACSLLTRNADVPFRPLLQSLSVLSALFVPVFVGTKWWGHCEIDDCKSERTWSRDDIGTFKVMASLVAAALARTRDISELANAARIIANSATILFRFAATSPYPISYFSHNVGRYGYNADELLGTPLRDLNIIHPEDLPKTIDDIVRLTRGITSGTSRDARMRAADGRYLWFEARMAPVHDDTGRVTEIEGLAFDIDKRKANESYIARFALIDQLTGLPNRTAFMEELRHAFTASKRGANPFSILYIDLDHFRDINDVLGHSKGDSLLKQVAQRLKGALRTGDTLARFGGDEFAILQLDVTELSDAGALAVRALHEIAEPPYDIGTQVDTTASIGIAYFGPDVADAEEMFKQADMALYRAKDTGRNQYHFHSEALDIAVIERVTLASDLRRGLDRGEFELYYQPQVEAASGRIVGIEALARWHHPKQGMVLPGHFIPIAEKTGAILPLGRWVIDQVCRQIQAWRAEQLTLPIVALNVSVLQMKSVPEFDVELMHSLKTWEIELTESVLMATTREHHGIIDRLNENSVSIAIDDFGTGYSSLSYLRAYRVSHIKIAQEFIQHIEEGSGDVAIVRAALSLARELGIKAIAEGVETAFQLRLLVEAGCQYVQGYYFSPPVPAAAMTEMLRHKVLSPAGTPDGSRAN